MIVRLAALVVALLVTGCSGSEHDADRSSTTTASGARIVPVDGRPSAIVSVGGVLWVADDERDVVVRLDPDGGAVGEPIVVAADPIALAADRGGVWVASASGIVTPLGGDGAPRHEPIVIDGSPTDVAVADGTAWVADIAAGAVIPIDAATGTPAAPVPVPAGAVRLVVDDGVLWVSGVEHSVTPIDLKTLAVGDPIDVGNGPIGMAMADRVLWVTNSDDDTVSRIDVASREVMGETLSVGDAPIALVSQGDVMWVLDQDGGTLTALDVATGERVRTIELGTRPRGLTQGEGGVWVVGVDPSAVVRVSSA